MQLELEEFTVRKRTVLEKQKVKFPENQICVIDGVNGIGKTVCLKQIFHQLKKLKKRAVLIEQDNNYLLYNRNILENIALTDDSEQLNEAEKLLKVFGMEYLKEQKLSKCSGGEKRVICILRGLFQKPDILLIDEPTNDLDYMMVNMLCDILKKSKSRTTVICISHDDRITKIADITYGIERGILTPDKDLNLFNIDEELKECADTTNTGEVRLIGRILSGKEIIYILTFFLLLISVYESFIKERYTVSYDIELPENEIQIIAPYTLCQEDLLGAIPVDAALLLYNDMNMNQKLTYLTNAVSRSEESAGDYDLSLDPQKGVDSYELEYFIFYDDGSRGIIFTIDTYEEKLGLPYNSVDTSAYFVGCQNGKSDEQHILLDQEAFENVVKSIKEEFSEKGRVVCSYIAVSLQDMSEMDFYQTKSFLNLSGKNYFVRSNSTIELVNELYAFRDSKVFIMRLIKFMMLYLSLGVLSFLIIMHHNERKLRIFYDAKAGEEIIRLNVRKKFRCKKMSLIILMLGVISGIIFTYTGGGNIKIVSWIGIAEIILSMSIYSFIIKVMLNQYVTYICDWSYR